MSKLLQITWLTATCQSNVH